ncbi:glycosylase [Flexithrix dorotheae]|uniref:glycosylase n=1 Tax=Flexithrix dorotheae TaxID=70993 RepID=UPI0012FA129B|nr:glycosylase [Flexithrix dorotheae]
MEIFITKNFTTIKKNKYWAIAVLFLGLFACQHNEKGNTDKENSPQENLQFPKEMVAFSPYQKNPLFSGTERDTWDKKIRERGFILQEDGNYKMWYSGYKGNNQDPKYLGYATSTDGINWERYAEQPIFEEKWCEDMMVTKHQGKYYMFAEGANDIAHVLVSVDGISWEELGDLEISQTNGEPIAPGPFGTPTVWIENEQWYLFYERDDEAIWLATSAGDPRIWKNLQDEPVLKKGPGDYDKGAVATNQIVKFQDKYFMYYHASSYPDWQSTNAKWSSNVAMSTDLIHWVKYPHNPIIEGDYSSPILVPDQKGNFHLYTMHDQVRLYLPTE